MSAPFRGSRERRPVRCGGAGRRSPEADKPSVRAPSETMSDLLQDFFQETDRNLSQVSGELDRWARAPKDPEALNSVFRIVHNIKATCHVMGFSRVEDLAHAAEDLLYTIREGQAEAHARATVSLVELEVADAVNFRDIR